MDNFSVHSGSQTFLSTQENSLAAQASSTPAQLSTAEAAASSVLSQSALAAVNHSPLELRNSLFHSDSSAAPSSLPPSISTSSYRGLFKTHGVDLSDFSFSLTAGPVIIHRDLVALMQRLEAVQAGLPDSRYALQMHIDLAHLIDMNEGGGSFYPFEQGQLRRIFSFVNAHEKLQQAQGLSHAPERIRAFAEAYQYFVASGDATAASHLLAQVRSERALANQGPDSLSSLSTRDRAALLLSLIEASLAHGSTHSPSDLSEMFHSSLLGLGSLAPAQRVELLAQYERLRKAAERQLGPAAFQQLLIADESVALRVATRSFRQEGSVRAEEQTQYVSILTQAYRALGDEVEVLTLLGDFERNQPPALLPQTRAFVLTQLRDLGLNHLIAEKVEGWRLADSHLRIEERASRQIQLAETLNEIGEGNLAEAFIANTRAALSHESLSKQVGVYASILESSPHLEARSKAAVVDALFELLGEERLSLRDHLRARAGILQFSDQVYQREESRADLEALSSSDSFRRLEFRAQAQVYRSLLESGLNAYRLERENLIKLQQQSELNPGSVNEAEIAQLAQASQAHLSKMRHDLLEYREALHREVLSHPSGEERSTAAILALSEDVQYLVLFSDAQVTGTEYLGLANASGENNQRALGSIDEEFLDAARRLPVDRQLAFVSSILESSIHVHGQSLSATRLQSYLAFVHTHLSSLEPAPRTQALLRFSALLSSYEAAAASRLSSADRSSLQAWQAEEWAAIRFAARDKSVLSQFAYGMQEQHLGHARQARAIHEKLLSDPQAIERAAASEQALSQALLDSLSQALGRHTQHVISRDLQILLRFAEARSASLSEAEQSRLEPLHRIARELPLFLSQQSTHQLPHSFSEALDLFAASSPTHQALAAEVRDLMNSFSLRNTNFEIDRAHGGLAGSREESGALWQLIHAVDLSDVDGGSSLVSSLQLLLEQDSSWSADSVDGRGDLGALLSSLAQEFVALLLTEESKRELRRFIPRVEELESRGEFLRENFNYATAIELALTVPSGFMGEALAGAALTLLESGAARIGIGQAIRLGRVFSFLSYATRTAAFATGFNVTNALSPLILNQREESSFSSLIEGIEGMTLDSMINDVLTLPIRALGLGLGGGLLLRILTSQQHHLSSAITFRLAQGVRHVFSREATLFSEEYRRQRRELSRLEERYARSGQRRDAQKLEEARQRLERLLGHFDTRLVAFVSDYLRNVGQAAAGRVLGEHRSSEHEAQPEIGELQALAESTAEIRRELEPQERNRQIAELLTRLHLQRSLEHETRFEAENVHEERASLEREEHSPRERSLVERLLRFEAWRESFERVIAEGLLDHLIPQQVLSIAAQAQTQSPHLATQIAHFEQSIRAEHERTEVVARRENQNAEIAHAQGPSLVAASVEASDGRDGRVESVGRANDERWVSEDSQTPSFNDAPAPVASVAASTTAIFDASHDAALATPIFSVSAHDAEGIVFDATANALSPRVIENTEMIPSSVSTTLQDAADSAQVPTLPVTGALNGELGSTTAVPSLVNPNTSSPHNAQAALEGSGPSSVHALPIVSAPLPAEARQETASNFKVNSSEDSHGGRDESSGNGQGERQNDEGQNKNNANKDLHPTPLNAEQVRRYDVASIHPEAQKLMLQLGYSPPLNLGRYSLESAQAQLADPSLAEATAFRLNQKNTGSGQIYAELRVEDASSLSFRSVDDSAVEVLRMDDNRSRTRVYHVADTAEIRRVPEHEFSPLLNALRPVVEALASGASEQEALEILNRVVADIDLEAVKAQASFDRAPYTRNVLLEVNLPDGQQIQVVLFGWGGSENREVGAQQSPIHNHFEGVEFVVKGQIEQTAYEMNADASLSVIERRVLEQRESARVSDVIHRIKNVGEQNGITLVVYRKAKADATLTLYPDSQVRIADRLKEAEQQRALWSARAEQRRQINTVAAEEWLRRRVTEINPALSPHFQEQGDFVRSYLETLFLVAQASAARGRETQAHEVLDLLSYLHDESSTYLGYASLNALLARVPTYDVSGTSPLAHRIKEALIRELHELLTSSPVELDVLRAKIEVHHSQSQSQSQSRFSHPAQFYDDSALSPIADWWLEPNAALERFLAAVPLQSRKRVYVLGATPRETLQVLKNGAEQIVTVNHAAVVSERINHLNALHPKISITVINADATSKSLEGANTVVISGLWGLLNDEQKARLAKEIRDSLPVGGRVFIKISLAEGEAFEWIRREGWKSGISRVGNNSFQQTRRVPNAEPLRVQNHFYTRDEIIHELSGLGLSSGDLSIHPSAQDEAGMLSVEIRRAEAARVSSGETESLQRSIAIIGAGPAGALLAAGLLTYPKQSPLPTFLRIYLVGDGEPGEGLPYKRRIPGVPEDLERSARVNVRAKAMYPGLFDFAHARDPEGVPNDHAFASRVDFGALIGRDLARAKQNAVSGRRLDRLPERAVGIDAKRRVTLASGIQIESDAVVYLPGNFPASDIPNLPHEILSHTSYIPHPLGEGFKGLFENEDHLDLPVLVVGTGLTGLDVSVIASKMGQKVLAVSRNGLWPMPHFEYTFPENINEYRQAMKDATSLAERNRIFDQWQNEQGVDPRILVDALRAPFPAGSALGLSNEIFASLSFAEQREFLNDRRWDRVRHRMPNPTFEALQQATREGRVKTRAASVAGARLLNDGSFEVDLLRPDGSVRTRRVRGIINATGPNGNYDQLSRYDPFVKAALGLGLFVPNRHRTGLAVDENGAFIGPDGQASDWFYSFGVATRGSRRFEITAMPEVAPAARGMAEYLLGRF